MGERVELRQPEDVFRPRLPSFHSGYSAVERKNIGKMTKFIVPAKFSSCRM